MEVDAAEGTVPRYQTTLWSPLLDVEECGSVDPILEILVDPERRVDPVAARQERQLVQPALQLRTDRRIVDVVRRVGGAVEMRHRLAQLVANREEAGEAGA